VIVVCPVCESEFNLVAPEHGDVEYCLTCNTALALWEEQMVPGEPATIVWITTLARHEALKALAGVGYAWINDDLRALAGFEKDATDEEIRAVAKDILEQEGLL
jgi:hypothetical protein